MPAFVNCSKFCWSLILTCSVQDKSKLADDIGGFFVRKIDRIRFDIDAVDIDPSARSALPPDQEVDAAHAFHSFQPLSENDVSALIRKSAKKSCPLDPMPTSLVVGCLDVLLPVISRIINLSLSCGHFSEEWKEALVTPILKKPGLDPTQLNNLRPVSNLNFISKLTERAVFDQIHSHMSRFALYPTSQSAYRKGHSTETALLKVQNDILINMIASM